MRQAALPAARHDKRAMTRTSQRKIQYIVAIAVVGAIIYLATRLLDLGTSGVLMVVFLLVVPGRLHGFLWRQLYRGRRLQQSGALDPAVKEYRAFLVRLERHRWLRRVWWLAWATYTRDPKAMTLNNLGGCLVDLGNLDEAEGCLREAIVIDPLYPVPHANLAELYAKRGDHVAAVAEASRAKELGLTGGIVDRILQGVQSSLAKVEGAGTSRPA